MTELPVTWARTARIFWALVWRYVVLFAVVAFIFGIIWSGVISYFVTIGFDIAPEDSKRWLMNVLRVMAAGLLYLTLRWVLEKRWPDFRIALVEVQDPKANASVKAPDVAGV
jgi:hypothetical protein